MAEEIKKAKAVRRSKLGSFTRKKNHLQQLLDGGAAGVKLKSVYIELNDVFKLLEKAHEDVLVALEEEDIDAEDVFMDAPATTLAEIDVKIGTAAETEAQHKLQEQLQQKTTEDEAAQKKDYDAALAVFKASVIGFGKPSANLSQLSGEKNISFF